MGWRLRLSDKAVRKFAELPIYYQRQKCSPGNVVSGSIRFMHSRGFAGEGASNKRGVVENGDFRFIRSLYSEHFTYIATRQLSCDIRLSMTLGIFQGQLSYFSQTLFVFILFFFCFCLPVLVNKDFHWTVSHQLNFSKTVCDTAKVTIDN